MFNGLNSVAQGKLGLVYAITALSENGYHVSVPLIDDQPYDLIADDGDRLYRVQVKSTRFKGDSSYYKIQLKHVHHNRTENVIRNFDNTKCDLLVCVNEEKTVYIIPTKEINVVSSLTLNEKYAKYKHNG